MWVAEQEAAWGGGLPGCSSPVLESCVAYDEVVLGNGELLEAHLLQQ